MAENDNPVIQKPSERASLGDVVSMAKLVQKTFSRNSLTRMAKESIFQFPVIMSADIPIEDATVIARAFEAYYAALMVSVISMRSDYRKKQFDSSGEYLKTFHQNNDLPNIFAGALRDIKVNESFTVDAAKTVNEYRKYVPLDAIMECWDTPDMLYNMSRLNTMYTPTTEAQRALEEYACKIRTMQIPAMEANTPRNQGQEVKVGDIFCDGAKNPIYKVTKILASGMPEVVKFTNDAKSEYNGGGPVGAPTGSIKSRTVIKEGVPLFNEDGTRPQILINGKLVDAVAKSIETDKEEPLTRVTGQQRIVDSKQLTALEPTLINLQLTSQDGAATITHNIVVGIKAMINRVPSSIMVSNLIDGANDSHGIFSKFIQWSEGTRRFVKDMILGIADAKENAQSDKYAAKWIRTLQRRKTSNMLSRLGGGEVLPNTTIGCTTAEVARVAESCGTDLSDAFSAIKFLSKYYLLSFFIYDAQEGKISVIFDGDTQFSITSVRNMKAKTSGKDLDLTQFFEVMKLMGK